MEVRCGDCLSCGFASQAPSAGIVGPFVATIGGNTTGPSVSDASPASKNRPSTCGRVGKWPRPSRKPILNASLGGGYRYLGRGRWQSRRRVSG